MHSSLSKLWTLWFGGSHAFVGWPTWIETESKGTLVFEFHCEFLRSHLDLPRKVSMQCRRVLWMPLHRLIAITILQMLLLC